MNGNQLRCLYRAEPRVGTEPAALFQATAERFTAGKMRRERRHGFV